LKDLYRPTGIQRLTENGRSVEADHLAKETLLRLNDANGTFVSLLGTPSHLDALFIGHCLCEGYTIEDNPILSIESTLAGGYDITSDRPIRMPNSELDRTRIVTSSCGACDSSGLDSLIEGLPGYENEHSMVTLNELNKAFKQMNSHQDGFVKTGGMHGAALYLVGGNVHHVAEDIGRHNAVDKSIGLALLNGGVPNGAILLLSGRCGWDIVAKAARSGIGTLACRGACSTLAADAARSLGMRIFSFVKSTSCVAIGILGDESEDKP
jgi:FdhD protein